MEDPEKNSNGRKWWNKIDKTLKFDFNYNIKHERMFKESYFIFVYRQKKK